MSGRVIAFTGLGTISRSAAKARAEAMGDKVTAAVSPDTDLLVAGPNAGSKCAKAVRLGIQIIRESVWLATDNTLASDEEAAATISDNLVLELSSTLNEYHTGCGKCAEAFGEIRRITADMMVQRIIYHRDLAEANRRARG